MEKVCLVQRRQQYRQNDISAQHTVKWFDADMISTFPQRMFQEPVVDEYDDPAGHYIRMIMTPDYSRILNNSEYIQNILKGSLCIPGVRFLMNDDGRMALHLRVLSSSINMIRCDQVCQMLQISRSFLQKLIHNKTIKSYKIGRLRRFMMEDILDYIIGREENAFSRKLNRSGPILLKD